MGQIHLKRFRAVHIESVSGRIFEIMPGSQKKSAPIASAKIDESVPLQILRKRRKRPVEKLFRDRSLIAERLFQALFRVLDMIDLQAEGFCRKEAAQSFCRRRDDEYGLRMRGGGVSNPAAVFGASGFEPFDRGSSSCQREQRLQDPSAACPRSSALPKPR